MRNLINLAEDSDIELLGFSDSSFESRGLSVTITYVLMGDAGELLL
jgi:hypothetical protein